MPLKKDGLQRGAYNQRQMTYVCQFVVTDRRGGDLNARDHEHPLGARLPGDDVLDHPIGEIFLLRALCSRFETATAVDAL
ncbi:MAG TPA: hypothetical protein VGH40_07325 [Roseiarcus sp.]